MDRWGICSSPSWTLNWFRVYKGQIDRRIVNRLLEETGCWNSEMTNNDKKKGSENAWIGIG